MENLKKKYIGDKAFYTLVLSIVVPMLIQNGISNFVNLLDNLMVGQIGTEQMSGVALGNQLMFIFNLCIFGGLGGVGIFTAQFFGSGSREGVQQTFRIKVYLAAFLFIAGALVFTLLGEPLLRLFLHEGDQTGNVELTLASGLEYLHIMIFGLVAFALTCVYASTLRECGETRLPMIAGLVAIFTNLIGNYILIYGHFGLPAMGVRGAALATVISRYVELAIVVIGAHRDPMRISWLPGVFSTLKVPGTLLKNVAIKGLPLLFNEALWSTGMSFLTQCYSTRGLIAIAGLNIASTITNLFNVFYFTLGNAVAIIVGQALGSGDMEKAKDQDRKLIALSMAVSVGVAGMLAIAAPFIPHLYNTSLEVRQLATRFILVAALCTPLYSFCHCAYFTIRSGGKTLVTFFFDCGFLWVVSIPLAFCLSRFTALPILPLYLICQSIDLLKCIVAYFLLKSGLWLNNIVN